MTRFWGWVLIVFGGAMDAAKLGLFLVGASTAPEDFALLPGKAAAVAAFIQRQPDIAFYGLGTAMLLVGAFLARSRHAPASVTAPAPAPSATVNITSHNQSGGVTAHTVNREDRNV